MNPSSVEGAAPQDCSRASSPCTDSLGLLIPLCLPALTPPFPLPFFFLLTTFLCSKVTDFPYGKKKFSLSYTICPPGITSTIPSLAVLGHTGTTSSGSILHLLFLPLQPLGQEGLSPLTACSLPGAAVLQLEPSTAETMCWSILSEGSSGRGEGKRLLDLSLAI